MISRRLLRVKALQVLYAYYMSDDRSFSKAENELLFSIRKAYDLYHYMFQLIIDVVFLAEKKIDIAKNKMIPLQEDLNPNTRFVDNFVIKQLTESNQLSSYVRDNCISWTEHSDFVKKMYGALLGLEAYKDYMSSESNSYEDDKKIVIKFFSHVVTSEELAYSLLEEESIYWNDDVDFVLSMVIKTIKGFEDCVAGEHISLMPLFKDSEDKDFIKKLFRESIRHHDEYLELIKSHAENWDVSRIAFMDMLIMELAMTEIVEFASIPIKVSFNEYLEIAKYYSTPNSSNFINGILDKMVETLINEKRINKSVSN